MTATAPHSDSRCTATAETWGKTFRCTRPVGHPGDMHSMNMSEPELPSRGSEMTATIETAEPITVEELTVLMDSAREHVAVAVEANRAGREYVDLPKGAMGIDAVLQTALRLLDTNFDD